MARIDKTDSAVGVVRGTLEADIPDNLLDTIVGVGINAKGNTVVGGGQSGIVGVMNPSRFFRKAGTRIDIFVLGDAHECDGLAAGRKVYADNVTGIPTTTAPADLSTATVVGWTDEAGHLNIRL
jgi:hypothetical protein